MSVFEEIKETVDKAKEKMHDFEQKISDANNKLQQAQQDKERAQESIDHAAYMAADERLRVALMDLDFFKNALNRCRTTPEASREENSRIMAQILAEEQDLCKKYFEQLEKLSGELVTVCGQACADIDSLNGTRASWLHSIMKEDGLVSDNRRLAFGQLLNTAKALITQINNAKGVLK